MAGSTASSLIDTGSGRTADVDGAVGKQRYLQALRDVQHELLALVEPLPEAELRQQFHADLSPLGWHLGHSVFVETFWICERLLGDRRPTGSQHDLYFPELSPKHVRGDRLPPKRELLDWARQRQREHLALLADPPAAARAHPLLADDYLPRFLLQHHAQHVEIMRMALAQRAAHMAPDGAGNRMEPRQPVHEAVRLPGGEYLLGSADSAAYDNEQPPRRVRLGGAWLAKRLVRNDEYLAFMESGGYRERRWWSDDGWRWLRATEARQPEHWQRTTDGGWLMFGPRGVAPLQASAALIGISLFEAQAYAAWAGGCLPHEYTWEAAAALGLLTDIGAAWEWCRNRFHPYPGFRAFPYDGYSLPWFDGKHYVLRGGSPYTSASIRRPSFRNFYTADKRHIFAGCRLAF
jgi:iron(II)-dependent oxidoreductase